MLPSPVPRFTTKAASPTPPAAAYSRLLIPTLPDFLPYNGEKNVEVGTTIEITFDRKMYAIGGADLTTAYVRNNVIELYKGDEDGTAVTFSVSLSSDKQTITVKPSAKLAGDTEYLVVLRKASLEDSNGNENERFSSTFTTAEAVSTGVTVTPANRSTRYIDRHSDHRRIRQPGLPFGRKRCFKLVSCQQRL